MNDLVLRSGMCPSSLYEQVAAKHPVLAAKYKLLLGIRGASFTIIALIMWARETADDNSPLFCTLCDVVEQTTQVPPNTISRLEVGNTRTLLAWILFIRKADAIAFDLNAIHVEQMARIIKCNALALCKDLPVWYGVLMETVVTRFALTEIPRLP